MFYNHKTKKCTGKMRVIKDDDPRIKKLKAGVRLGKVVSTKHPSEEELTRMDQYRQKSGWNPVKAMEEAQRRMREDRSDKV